jgi:hypothetical protein
LIGQRFFACQMGQGDQSFAKNWCRAGQAIRQIPLWDIVQSALTLASTEA